MTFSLSPVTHPMPARPFAVVSRSVAQFGSALGSGPRGRGFESHHSDQKDTAKGCAKRTTIENAAVVAIRQDRNEAGTT